MEKIAVKKAVIALGSNLGERLEFLQRAVGSLGRLPGTKVTALSCVYETDPVGYADQPRFLNAAAVIKTELPPLALLGGCLGIESALGRVRRVANGPRTIDLDILLYEGESSGTALLTLPHPRMMERTFVLMPLLDLFPKGTALGVEFKEKLKALPQEGIVRRELTIRGV